MKIKTTDSSCPLCDSNLRLVNHNGFLDSVFSKNSEDRYECPLCDWHMTVKEVTERGGIEEIRETYTRKITKKPVRSARRMPRGKETKTVRKRSPRQRRRTGIDARGRSGRKRIR